MTTEPMQATFVLVTPDLAAKWLTRNIKNRPPKEMKIATYARDMLAGDWRLTGEAIKFDSDGNLLDGQNRLAAVVRSGCTVPMLVVLGLDPAVQRVMDSGAPRSAADFLHLEGYVSARSLAAAARVLADYERGFFRNAMVRAANNRPSHSELAAIIESHPGLDDSVRAAGVLNKALPLPVSAAGAAHYLFNQIDVALTKAMFARLTENRTDGLGDPINTLIKYTLSATSQRRALKPAMALFFMFRTWNALRAGQRLTMIKVQDSGEFLSMPTISGRQ